MNVEQIQTAINDGSAFTNKEMISRAKVLMFLGVCHLPFKSYIDFNGEVVPSVKDALPFSIGSIENSIFFYKLIELRLN